MYEFQYTAPGANYELPDPDKLRLDGQSMIQVKQQLDDFLKLIKIQNDSMKEFQESFKQFDGEVPLIVEEQAVDKLPEPIAVKTLRSSITDDKSRSQMVLKPNLTYVSEDRNEHNS